jgi:hypothetical protein
VTEERIGTHTRSLLFPRILQVFEAEGELDSHSLAGKKRVDQATIGHRTDEVKYSKTEDSNPRK